MTFKSAQTTFGKHNLSTLPRQISSYLTYFLVHFEFISGNRYQFSVLFVHAIFPKIYFKIKLGGNCNGRFGNGAPFQFQNGAL